MEIILRCADPAVLAQAAACLERRLGGAKYEKSGGEDTGVLRYAAGLDAGAGEAALTELLRFGALDISASSHYDLPERDRSWWGVTRYESVTEPDGTRRLESSSETHWS